jgi:hypothetical protein
VNSADSFVVFVESLRESLDEALAVPAGSQWDEERGDWKNPTLASFIDGMANRIAAVRRLPLGRETERIWSVLLPTHGIWDGGSEELRQYLDDVASWATTQNMQSTHEPWHAAAEAMAAGVGYE